MQNSTDIRLPSNVKPIFPDKCLVCQSKPDSMATIPFYVQEWPLAAVLIPLIGPVLAIGSWSRVEVPICKACKWKLAWKTWSRRLLIVAPLIVAAIWFMPDFSTWPRMVEKLAVLARALLFVVPYVDVELFWPRLFAAHGDGEKTDYAFASGEYAEEFEGLNSNHVLSSD